MARIALSKWAVLMLGVCSAPLLAADLVDYFPLRVGNWWAYEEIDAQGARVSRETWTVVPSDAEGQPGEFHLRSYSKRLDPLRGRGNRFEGHEYLRTSAAGLHKRYPRGRDAAQDVTLLKRPLTAGARWHDAQGDCEVVSHGGPCAGPKGELPDCAVVVCTLGSPASTIVTSTYGQGVGMVRQDLELVQLIPSGELGLSCDDGRSGRSVLRLTTYHVAAPAVPPAQRR
jgi:hypothetical protein